MTKIIIIAPSGRYNVQDIKPLSRIAQFVKARLGNGDATAIIFGATLVVEPDAKGVGLF